MVKKESETYEKMLKQVESIIADISSEQAGLDEIVGKVETAYDLITKMRARLDQSKEKIENLRGQFSDSPS